VTKAWEKHSYVKSLIPPQLEPQGLMKLPALAPRATSEEGLTFWKSSKIITSKIEPVQYNLAGIVMSISNQVEDLLPSILTPEQRNRVISLTDQNFSRLRPMFDVPEIEKKSVSVLQPIQAEV